MQPSKTEVEAAILELHDAMIESIAASEAEDRAKARKIRAHKRLSLARDAIRFITFS